jgi:hypothetical protein
MSFIIILIDEGTAVTTAAGTAAIVKGTVDNPELNQMLLLLLPLLLHSKRHYFVVLAMPILIQQLMLLQTKALLIYNS